MKKKNYYQYLFAFGHFCSDINQTALSALLPFLIASYHYDYTTAALLVMLANIVGSVVQPLLGQFADKRNSPWIMAAGLLLAGGGMAVTGCISNFIGLSIAVMISGIGIAMFHPQAAKLVNHVSTDENRGMTLSIFSFGGSLGSTFGPILLTGSIALFGIKGTLTFFIPPIIICAIIISCYKNLKEIGADSVTSKGAEGTTRFEATDQWHSFAKLCIVMFGRSIVYYGLNTFLALYWIHNLGQSETVANGTISIYYGIGAVCTLIGGKLADKYGNRFIVKIGFVILLPTVLFLPMTNHVYTASLLLIPMSAAIQMVYSPMVVLGQKYLPNRVGLASGVTLGLAVSVGGIVAPVLGKVADVFGLEAAMYVLAAIAIVPMLVSFFLSPVQQNT